MMRKAGTLDRFVAGVLTVTLAGYFVPATAIASTPPAVSAPVSAHAEIRGNVFGADGLTAIPGVTVKAAHMETQRVYTSDSTGADGVYRFRDLPPGSYDLAVQTAQGLFAADALVEAKAGRRTTVSLAIRPAARQEEKPEEQEGEKPAEQTPEEGKKEGEEPADKPAEPQAQKPPKKSGGFWRSPAGAAVAIVAGAVVVGVAANSAVGDDEEDDEPLTQSGN
jgi:hypothetical protein